MRNWKPGDRAICITPGSRIEGLKVAIMSGIKYGPIGGMPGAATAEAITVNFYYVDPGFPTPIAQPYWAAQPRHLIPIPDNKHNFERFHHDLKPCDADYEWNPNEVVTL